MIFEKKHTHRRKPLMAILQLIAEKENGIKRARGKYFNMIHSCGNLEADDTSKPNVSWVALSGNENKGFHYHQGFFLRILKGPFRHWGTNIQLEKDSNSIGKVQLRRIYLWY